MSNWKSASEAFIMTQQEIAKVDAFVESKVPFYMDKAMNRIMDAIQDCHFECRIEFHPEHGEDMELFDKIVSAVRKKLASLGYSVANNQSRFGIRISWASNPNGPQIR
jgi:hypothetical protein